MRKEEGPEGDAFTRWFTYIFDNLVARRFSKLLWRRVITDSNTTIYKAPNSARIAEIITLMLASLLPTASIFALYYITSPVIRLTFIMLFSAVFTGCLAFFTSAKRMEIFSAAVALAAVQVVFIGTSNGAGGAA